MRRGFLMPWVLGVLCAAASPVLAQDAPAQSMSWFRMFLWADDLIGLLMIWVIVLMSAVSIGFMIKFAIDYRRVTIIPDETHDNLAALLAEKRYREAIEYSSHDPSFLGKVVSSALHEASDGYGAMERAVEESSDVEITRMLRPLEYLNIIGNLGPMMGLFGTVYGMIVAFQKLVESGGKPDPAKLAGGISTALITTFWGLVVAMPALAAYALIRNKVDALVSEGMIMAEELIKPFKPGAKKTTTSAPPSRSTAMAGRAGARSEA